VTRRNQGLRSLLRTTLRRRKRRRRTRNEDRMIHKLEVNRVKAI